MREGEGARESEREEVRGRRRSERERERGGERGRVTVLCELDTKM